MSLKASRDFCRRFGIGLRAGADLMKLLESEAKHGPPKQRAAMIHLRESAKEGRPLAEAMDESLYFPPLLASMTRVGEATGRLERTMLAVSEHYAQQVILRSNFLRAITWPTIQLILGIGIISLLILIMGMLKTAGGGEMMDILGFGLRGPSGVLIFWAYIATFLALIVGVIVAFKKNIGGVQNTIPLLYRIPVIGSAIQTITLSRFAWTLSLALDAGLNPIPAIKLSLDSTDSDFYRSGTKRSEDAIRKGATMAGGLLATDLFPDEFITQIEIAELSGTDAESIDHLAKDYDERAKQAMKTIAGIATGLIWFCVAGFLIFLIFRMVVNIGGVYNSVQEPIIPRRGR